MPARPGAHDDLALGDAALTARAIGGSEEAFAELLRRHGPALRRTALRTTRNGADADDVVQDAVLAAWQAIGSLREPARFRSWLLQITGRKALALVVARREEQELKEDVALLLGPEADVDRFDLEDGVRVALRSMPEEQARAWVLREIGRLSYRDIAERLDAPESSVRGWLVLGRRRVQAEIRRCCPFAHPATAPTGIPAGSVAGPVAPPVRAAVATWPASGTGEARASMVSSLHRDLDLDLDAEAVPQEPRVPTAR